MARAKRNRVRRGLSWRTFGAGVALVAGMFALHFAFRGIFQRAELIAYDFRVNRLPIVPSTGQIAIVAIDDKSIAELGQWPWPRARFGDLVSALGDYYKAGVIAFDVIFSEEDRGDAARAGIAARMTALGIGETAIAATLGPPNDAAFAAALKKQGATVLAYAFRGGGLHESARAAEVAGYLAKVRPPGPMTYTIVRQAPGAQDDLLAADAYLPPIESLGNAARALGFVNIDADADGEIRSVLTAMRFNDRYCIPLFMAAADVAAGGAPTMLAIRPGGVAQVSLAGVPIPVDDLGRMLVNFRRGPDPFPYYSAVDVLNHKIPPNKLAGKIVLIGAIAHGLGDRAATPINPDMPRVEIHAHAIDNLLKGDFFRRNTEGEGIALLGAMAIGLIATLAAAWMPAAPAALVSAGAAGAYLWYAQHRLAADGTVIGVVFPLATGIVVYMALASYRYIAEGREKRQIRNAFEHYLHPDVIASMLESREGLKLGGERRHLAILFADIVGFTSRAERSEPEEIAALLNTYMTAMIDVIMRSGGVVDKLMGDGIMAFWGAPNELENPSRSAIGAALEMLGRLAELKKTDARFADLEIGIGVASGDVIVGNFGGESRFDYSAIGDTVNFASRLEGLTRHFQVPLLASRDALREAGDGFLARELGMVKVKGKQQAVAIVEVAGRGGDGADAAFYRRFNDALGKLRAGAAASALNEFRELATNRPDDAPVQIFLEKLAANPEHPPTEMVLEFESK
ncbi:MAG: CHASE2 domain-containing protein [Candidatus Binataceae bacterium]